MRKLNKTQIEIEGIAGRVPQLTDKQKEWARRNINYFRSVGKETKETVCPDCKEKISLDSHREKGSKWCKDDFTIRCPHCGAKIQVRTWGNGTLNASYNRKQEDYFQVLNVVGDWQVTRLFYMRRYCYVRKANTPWEYYEVCQAWNNPKYGKTYFRSLPKSCCICHPFNPYKLYEWIPLHDEDGHYKRDDKGNYLFETKPCELEPRRVGGANYFNTDTICPNGQILPEYKKRGVSTKSLAKTPFNMMGICEYIVNPMFETLIKFKEFELIKHITQPRNENDANAYFTAWRICKRNGYDFKKSKKSLTEWIDLVHILIRRGVDYHNPHYVCPANLHEMHNRFVEIEQREQEQRLEQERRERNARARERARVAMLTREEKNEEFIQRRKAYFGLGIENNCGFKIVALRSIDDFEREAKIMKHCVFVGGYYLKEESLILSARDKNDKPIETIEIDLRSFRILQCYGPKDTHTPLHSEIVKTMTENMWQVKEIAEGKKRVAC